LENLSADFVEQLIYKHKFIEVMSLEIPSNSETINVITKQVKECILKTDMCFHFKMLDELLDISDYNNRVALVNTLNISSLRKISSVPNRLIIESPLSGSSSSSVSSTSFFGPAANIIFQNAATRQNMLGLILHAAGKFIFLDISIWTYINTLDISNPIRPYSICKKWSTLVMEEFHNQGVLEKKAGYPISPNMNSSISDQAQVQLTFTQVIVQPMFEVFLDLFPRTINLMDLIVDNVRLWGGKNTTSPDKQEPKKTSEKYKKKSSLSQSPTSKSCEGPRRVSIAAGIIDIPESLQKYLSRSKARNSLRVGASESRLSSKESRLSSKSTTLDFFHEENIVEEELENFGSGNLSKSPEKESTIEEAPKK
jgi:hypothetical protein